MPGQWTCLSSRIRVRHKDIKPRNILVHYGNIIFVDFGLTFDFFGADSDTTINMVNGMTPRYCAPEVADCLPRNKSADVWSLGVVFLEITILTGDGIEFMRTFLDTHGTKVDCVQKNISGLADYLGELRGASEVTTYCFRPYWTHEESQELLISADDSVDDDCPRALRFRTLHHERIRATSMAK
ncbi:hypothetical protein P171DRAFT_471322 [Karstenula rhodostoma CBS 690.94]|uniref:Protein kinase domain-containing protein n=1 Tax=Karstenula rhodostoma CBS 690.94 TaxID=1392251 RepID=A0A9P4PMQ0_9PLEO|nr:hypothetical protein P171DRAFT_471322 [Karstenula rhodostoma CBS 690.94]